MSPSISEARHVAASRLASRGVPSDRAKATADALVTADCWGIHSHGLSRLPFYVDRLKAGGCNPHAELKVLSDSGSVLILDGQNGLGHWQLWDASHAAIERCREHGLVIIGIRGSSHCGCLGVYTLPLLKRGLVSIVMSTGPAVMPAPGGRIAVLSTSPIAAGIPSFPNSAIVDLATSAVSRGRVKRSAQMGEQLEAGLAFSSDGEPTRDATEALSGMLAPMAGPKGYALAFVVEALTAGLLGPQLAIDIPDMFDGNSLHQPQGIAHLLLAIDPKVLSGDALWDTRLERLTETIISSGGRVPGSSRHSLDELSGETELLLPGDVWPAVKAIAVS